MLAKWFNELNISVRPKKINMCVSAFSFEQTRYGRLALSFYLTEIFYIDITFFNAFSSIFQHS